MIDINTAAVYWLCPDPADMRKGRDKLASIVREKMNANPIHGENAFIFYSKDLRMIKILHHDLTGYEMYIKWFEDGKMLKPVFEQIRCRHTITKSQLLLLMTGVVQTTLRII